jgi:hypothetical protein
MVYTLASIGEPSNRGVSGTAPTALSVRALDNPLTFHERD